MKNWPHEDNAGVRTAFLFSSELFVHEAFLDLGQETPQDVCFVGITSSGFGNQAFCLRMKIEHSTCVWNQGLLPVYESRTLPAHGIKDSGCVCKSRTPAAYESQALRLRVKSNSPPEYENQALRLCMRIRTPPAHGNQRVCLCMELNTLPVYGVKYFAFV